MLEKNRENALAIMKLLEQQESDLTFDSFTRRDALRLGTILSEIISEYPRPLTARIFIGDIVVYQYAMEGNEESRFGWTYRKYQMLKATGHASMHAKVRRRRLDELTEFDDKQDVYAFACGAFPITVKGQGIIGAAVVSGLPDPADHPIVVEALEKMLGKKTVTMPEGFSRAFFD